MNHSPQQLEVQVTGPIDIRTSSGPRETSPKHWHDPPGFSGVNTTITVAAALLTALGIGSGIAFRMLRNDPLWWWAPLLLLLVAGSAFTLITKHRVVWAIAYAAFFGSVVGLVYRAVQVSVATERPRVVTTFETLASGLVKVTASIKAEGLLRDSMIYVIARGGRRTGVHPVTGEVTTPEIPTNPDASAQTNQETGEQRKTRIGRAVIKEAIFGPNADGAIDAQFTFEVSPALFQDVVVQATRTTATAVALSSTAASDQPEPISTLDCIPKDQMPTDYGCARFILPRAPLRPVISVSYSQGSDATVDILTTNISAGSVPPLQFVQLSVWAESSLITRQMLGPDAAGVVRATAAVPLTAKASCACAVAELMNYPPANPLTSNIASTAPPTPESLSYCKEGSSVPSRAAVAVINNFRSLRAELQCYKPAG